MGKIFTIEEPIFIIFDIYSADGESTITKFIKRYLILLGWFLYNF